MRFASAALLALLTVGCGNEITSAPPVGGRVYAVTGANQLLVFTNQNQTQSTLGTSNPSVAVNLPVSGPVAVDIDRTRDRLYVTCDGGGVSGAGRLLVYSNASQINSSSSPAANIGLSAGSPIDASYDDNRDILYVGDRTGLVTTLRSASTATSATTLTFTPPPPPAVTLQNSVLIDAGSDRLFTAASNSTNVITLPTYANASANLAPSNTTTPNQLTNALDLAFENTRLLVLDGATFGAANTRVLRFETPYSGVNPNLTASVPNAVCLRYDPGQNNLYVGLSTNTVSVFSNASAATGTNLSGARTLNTNAATNDLCIDNSRN